MPMRFDDVVVKSAVLGPGYLFTDDPIIGAKVGLNNALVCDLNPEGFDCTQVFSSALQVYAPNALWRATASLLAECLRAQCPVRRTGSAMFLFTPTFPRTAAAAPVAPRATFILSFEVRKTDLRGH